MSSLLLWYKHGTAFQIKKSENQKQYSNTIPLFVLNLLCPLFFPKDMETKMSQATNLGVRLTARTGDVSSAVSEVSSASTSMSSSLLKWENRTHLIFSQQNLQERPLLKYLNRRDDTALGSTSAWPQPHLASLSCSVTKADEGNRKAIWLSLPETLLSVMQENNYVQYLHLNFLF